MMHLHRLESLWFQERSSQYQHIQFWIQWGPFSIIGSRRLNNNSIRKYRPIPSIMPDLHFLVSRLMVSVSTCRNHFPSFPCTILLGVRTISMIFNGCCHFVQALSKCRGVYRSFSRCMSMYWWGFVHLLALCIKHHNLFSIIQWEY